MRPGRPRKDNMDTQTERPMITAQEADSIKDDLDKLKEMAGAGEMKDTGYSPTAQIDDICVDKDSIRRKIDVLSRQLERHSNQKVSDPVKRDRLMARRKELEEKFKPVLESYQDLGVVRRDSADWGQAYKKAIERPRYEHYIAEWKRIGIMLEPEDREINNLDNLRRDK